MRVHTCEALHVLAVATTGDQCKLDIIYKKNKIVNPFKQTSSVNDIYITMLLIMEKKQYLASTKLCVSCCANRLSISCRSGVLGLCC